MIEKFAKKTDLQVPEKLRGLVVGFITGETDAPVNLQVPIFANGFPLIVNIYSEKPTYTINGEHHKPPSSVCLAGQVHNAEIIFNLKGVFGQIGIILHPAALYYLFHKPGCFFTNQWIALERITEIRSPVLCKKLEDCCSTGERFALLLEFLELLASRRLPPIEWLDNTLDTIFEEDGLTDQEQLIQETAISSRHFRRIFKNVVGVPPKYFCKVIQLNTFFELLKSGSSEKIHHLAVDCGYYDQAHFIKDFYRLMYDTPGHFLSGEHAYIQSYMGRPETQKFLSSVLASETDTGNKNL